jgi:exonuclease SbcC
MIRIRRIAAHNFKQLREVDLYLPEIGRFLVQGKNEAGKSTLFEAVFFGLFGQALVTETGTRRLDDLIAYGVEKARVEVWLEAQNRPSTGRRAEASTVSSAEPLVEASGHHLFKISRTIVRDKANVWELEIESPTGIEEVRGNRTVNQRIVEELGFDGEALLNTCFVEQKKLEKLEGMNRAKREESLMKLLNLEAMVRMEGEFKIRGEDRLALARCEQRAELANIQAELPEKEEALGQVQGKLLFIGLQRDVEAMVQERRTIGQLEEEIAALTSQCQALAERVAQVDHLKEGLQALREVQSYRERVVEQRQEVERLEGEIEEAKRLQREALPALEERLRSLRLLRSRLERLGRVVALQEEQEAQAASLAADLAALKARQAQREEERRRLEEITATVQTEEAELAALEAAVRDFEVGEALEGWLAAQREVSIPAQLGATIGQKQEERDRLSQRFKIGVFGFLAAFMLSAALIFAFTASFLRWGIALRSLSALAVTFLILTAALLALLAWRLWILWRALGQTAVELGQLEGERRTLEAAAERERERLAVAEEQLRQLGVTPPESAEVGQARVAELAEKTGSRTRGEVVVERDGVRGRLAQARALYGEVGRGIERLEAEIASRNEGALQESEAACRRAVEKARGILERWGAKAAALAEELGVKAELSAVQSLLGGLAVEAQGMRRRIASIPAAQAEIARREEGIEELWQKAQERYQQLQISNFKLQIPNFQNLTDEDYRALEGALRGAYEELGGEGARRDLERVQGELGRKEGERRTRVQRAAQLLQGVQESLVSLGLEKALSESPPLEELEELLTRLQNLDLGEESALLRERDELRERIGYLREQRAALEEALGLEGELLDLEACHQELASKRQELAVRERATRIVEVARRRVVTQILPSTMEHMRRLLPTLTMHRYYDAELDPETYQIRVWDERAGDRGGWRQKNIFSGGTKDQFSLALRLAFALATLPAERGAAPSFIFLDEPLGSFDDERAQALLHLLTEGQIAESFDQIFLISHVRVDPHLFNYHLTIEGGRVVENDLPPFSPQPFDKLRIRQRSGPTDKELPKS